MNVVEHVEKFLGRFSQGWKVAAPSSGLQIVRFENVPFETVNTYMTLGLSHHELIISDEKKVRQELILPILGAGISEKLISFLLFICELILRSHNAVLRGQVIRLPMDVAEKLGFDAVYCAIPVFLDDDFATFSGSQPPTVIVWVVPIYKDEADYIDKNGWEMFEDLLVEKDPDLFSLERKPITM